MNNNEFQNMLSNMRDKLQPMWDAMHVYVSDSEPLPMSEDDWKFEQTMTQLYDGVAKGYPKCEK
jgi:hypothetical protein